MTTVAPPPVTFEGRRWTVDEMSALAGAWAVALVERLPPRPSIVAAVLENQPESVALYFALSSLPVPLAVLPTDPAFWPDFAELAPGAPLVLSSALASLAREAERVGARPLLLPRAGSTVASSAPAVPFLRSPGVILFTAGTTGPPKAVYRTTASLLALATAVSGTFRLRRGGTVLGAVPLAGAHGLPHVLMMAAVCGSTVSLLPRFQHEPAVKLFASEEITYFPCTPLMVDLLVRCRLEGTAPRGPEVVKVSTGRLPRPLFAAFRQRFGVSPRPSYGSTETGTITADTASETSVRPESVGRALPGVRLVIGDRPDTPAAIGSAGRVWAATPWFMEGYGVPPRLEPPASVDGLWPTQDVGRLDEDGYLTLLGRVDDSFKTQGGHLVNAAEIARILELLPGVREVAVVPLNRAFGSAIGVLVAGDGPLDGEAVRWHATRHLPAWSQPRVVLVVPELPRLPRGKVDPFACLARLHAAYPDLGGTP